MTRAPVSPRPRRLLLKFALGLLISAGLIGFLLRYVDRKALAQLASVASWWPLAAGLGLFGVMYGVRTARFVLVAPRTPALTMFWIASVHTLLLRIMPLRTGDLSYAFLVRRAGTAGLGESLIDLLVVRLLDAVVVTLLFCVALVLREGSGTGQRVGLFAAIALAGILALVHLAHLLRLGLALLRGLLRLLGLERRPAVERLLARVASVVGTYDKTGPAMLVKLTVATTAIWLLHFATYALIVRALGLPIGVLETMLGGAASVASSFLPIGGIGTFGTLEVGWVLGFVLVGLDREQAVLSGLGVSLATFGYAVIFGLVGWIGLLSGQRRQNDRA